jgi:microcystin-dependent protein
MSNPYVGEIRMFGGNFAPQGWAFCDGSLWPISEYETLFNLIGTTYGGDGQETFALPDLRGRLPVHQGTGLGLSTAVIGQSGGVETVTLTLQQMPAHTHPLQAATDNALTANAGGNLLAQTPSYTPYIVDTPSMPLSSGSIAQAGGSQPHDNLQPFLCISFIISLFGIFPSQS